MIQQESSGQKHSREIDRTAVTHQRENRDQNPAACDSRRARSPRGTSRQSPGNGETARERESKKGTRHASRFRWMLLPIRSALAWLRGTPPAKCIEEFCVSAAYRRAGTKAALKPPETPLTD